MGDESTKLTNENINNILKKWTVSSEDNRNSDTNLSYTYKTSEGVEKKSKKTTTSLDIDKYYALLSGMSPEIKVKFKNGKDWKEFCTTSDPYIRSVSIKDNGVKTLTLEMMDPGFGYPAYKATNGEEEAISIDQIIKKSIVGENAYTKDTATDASDSEFYNDDNTLSEETMKDNYLKYDNSNASHVSVANVMVRIGYADYNYKDKANKNRTNFWWDMSGEYNRTVYYKKYNGTLIIDSKKSDSAAGKTTFREMESNEYLSGMESSSENNKSQVNDNEAINRFYCVNFSDDQTTVRTPWFQFMITGFKTKITETGITYSISGIEVKDYDLYSKAFLQRYANIEGTPNAVLASLMLMFNSSDTSNSTAPDGITGSPIVLYYDVTGMNSTIGAGTSFGLVQEFDKDSMDESDLKMVEGYSDTAEYYQCKSKIYEDLEKIKKIKLSLGNERALNNYSSDDPDKKKKAWKTIASLMNEFCSLCPPLKKRKTKNEQKEDSTSYIDKNGDKVDLGNSSSVSYPLKWLSFWDQANNKTIIVLYYRKPQKIGIYRNYDWGIGTNVKTCIQELSVENSNEFALLSASTALSGGEIKGRYLTYKEDSISSLNNNTETSKMKLDGTYNSTRVCDTSLEEMTVADNVYASQVKDAYTSSLYKGNIKICGDPFFYFDGVMKPCEYPINLRVWLPDGKGKKYMHESSGVYVVTDITHSVSTSGFETTLGIMSYPGVVDDTIKTS